MQKVENLELLDKIMIGKNSGGKPQYADINQLTPFLGLIGFYIDEDMNLIGISLAEAGVDFQLNNNGELIINL